MTEDVLSPFTGRIDRVEITARETELRHYISDEELNMLGTMNKDLVAEICLASIGVVAGSLVPAIDGFQRFGALENPTTYTDLLSMLLCFSSVAVAAVTGLIWRKRSKVRASLVDEIRNRPKRWITHDQPA